MLRAALGNGVLNRVQHELCHLTISRYSNNKSAQNRLSVAVQQLCNNVTCGADTPGGNQVDKRALGPQLEAPVQRIFYMMHEGRQDHEVYPNPNPALLAELESCDAVLYGMGSLYTSICPSLILQVLMLHPASPHPICNAHPPAIGITGTHLQHSLSCFHRYNVLAFIETLLQL